MVGALTGLRGPSPCRSSVRPVPDSEFHALGRTSETMIRLARDGDAEAAITIWKGLDEREQQMVWFALVQMVNHLRAERGDPPDATYGPPEIRGL